MQPGITALVQPVSSVDQRQCLLHELQLAIGAKSFQHWFQGRAAIDIATEAIRVRVGSQFQLTWMQRRFGADVIQSVKSVVGGRLVLWEVDPQVGSDAKDVIGGSAEILALLPAGAEVTLSASATAVLAGPSRSLADAASGSDQSRQLPAAKAPTTREGYRYAGLDEFVVGPCNELAFTAAKHVCEAPGQQCNPLYLHGSVGTGKTHLAEGIFKAVRRQHPDMKLLFMTAEAFANQFTHALRSHSLPGFRQRFRSVDLLIIDDAKFFDGKPGIQEEFLHTIKLFSSQGKQLVLTSDSHPRLLSQTSEELVSRFLCGMVCRLETPDFQTRRKIAQAKAIDLAASISEDVLDLVARRFTSNVREIEGALNTLRNWQRMSGKRITLVIAKQVLADLERDCVRVVKLADIEAVVCNLFGVQGDDLRSDVRTRAVSQPRMLAMYLARKHTPAAYKEIGEFFGGRNHSTVMAAERKVDSWLQSETDVSIGNQSWRLSEVLERLEQQLMAS